MPSSNSKAVPSKIFISYRRSESAAHAGRLADQLIEHFGAQFVDIDIESIEPGIDFDKAIEEALSTCKILLVVIGRQWLTCANEYGRRLDNPNDYVRREIVIALNRGIRIIPVLVEGVTMPLPQDLPDELAPFAGRQAWKVRDFGWKEDVRNLIEKIEGDITPPRADEKRRRGTTVHPEKKGFRYAPIIVIVLVIAFFSAFALRQMPSRRSDEIKVEPSPASIASPQPTGTMMPTPIMTPTPSPSPAQPPIKPITRDNLISSIKLGRGERKTAERYIAFINYYGVNFSLTPEDEGEIRRSGDYLGRTGLDNLVTAIRNNYRPSASPTETVAKEMPRSSSTPELGEPTEAEMKEALLRAMEKRGGQRTGDNTIVIGNIIAGMTIKIEKFEKLGCKPTNYGAGYECTYNSTISQSLHSNDGTERGNEHAAALNKLMGGLGGNAVNETVTRKFVRGSEGWIVFQD